MPAPPLSGKQLPASLAAIHLDTIIDLLGRNGADAVLRSAGLGAWIEAPPKGSEGTVDFSEFAAMQAALADTLGWKGARGLSRRMGGHDFEALVKPIGAIAAMADPAFQGFPLERRLRAGLHGVAKSLDQLGPFEAAVGESQPLTFQLEACPECWGRKSDSPICASVAGLLAAALRWIAPELEAGFEETECRASGASACRFTLMTAPANHNP